jgi:allantoin racemase
VSDTTMRIWHQSMTELEELGAYRTTLEGHARQVLPGTTTVSVHGLPAGSYGGLAPSDVLGYPYAYHLVLGHAIEAAYQAEQQGYDAFVVGSYSEPFLREIRSLVDIPVASLAESTFLVACSLGKYQALIANSPSIARIVSAQVHKHGLRERVTGVYSMDPPLTENRLSAAYQDAGQMIEDFRSVARRAIEAGADVVVPAEGVLAELLWANGVDRVDDVPVMDSLGVAWHYAEMMVGLWQRTNLRVGRRWEYPRAPEDMLARVREVAGLRA